MNKISKRIKDLYILECRRSIVTFILVCLRTLYYKVFYRKSILSHPGTIIRGAANIHTGGLLSIGLTNAGFVHKHDVTLLNIQGSLTVSGKFRIARGCRIDIGPSAKVTLREGSYINANTLMIIMHSLTMGPNCVISWNCQFLDEDFHEIEYEGKKQLTSNGIVLSGNNWVGCGVKIYKGTFIAEGCVIAADSVVRGSFHEKNTLIGGNPARVLKTNVNWY